MMSTGTKRKPEEEEERGKVSAPRRAAKIRSSVKRVSFQEEEGKESEVADKNDEVI